MLDVKIMALAITLFCVIAFGNLYIKYLINKDDKKHIK